MITEIQLKDGPTATNREVFQDISNVTTAQTSDTIADDSLPGCSHWSPRLVNQESAPYQTKDQPETSQAERNQFNQQAHPLEPDVNPVYQAQETSQPTNVPTRAKSDGSFVLTSP